MVMAIIQMVLSLGLLSFFYVRMIRREVPEPIDKKQAIVPVLLGVVSTLLSLLLLLGIGFVVTRLGYNKENVHNPVLRAFLSAFFGAALNEELAKLLMILLSFRIFRPKNLYEYILIGFAVGMGFTVFEEFSYGGAVTTLTRLFTFSLHSVFGMIMAKHLFLAHSNKRTGKGSVAGEIVLALVLPMLLHMIFDAATGFNPALRMLSDNSENADAAAMAGGGIAIVVVVVFTVGQFVMLSRLKKKAPEYSAMEA